MSLSEYSRHRGCSLTAVQQAVKALRIKRNPDGTIESVQADRDCRENTDHSKNHYAKRRTPRAVQPTPDDLEAGLKRVVFGEEAYGHAKPPNGPEGMSYHAARPLREAYQAQLKKLELEEKQTSLVSLSHVEAAYYNFFHILRDLLSSVPNRIAVQIAAETNPVTVFELLHTEIARVLKEAAGKGSQR
jgi:hypothetical protein